MGSTPIGGWIKTSLDREVFYWRLMYTCKTCGKEFEKGQSLGAHILGAHIHKGKKRERFIPRTVLTKTERICPWCGEHFPVEVRTWPDGHQTISNQKYCSKDCSHHRSQTKKTKEKISHTLQTKSSWIIDGRTKVEKFCSVCGKSLGFRTRSNPMCRQCINKTLEYRIRLSRATKGKNGGYRTGYKTNKMNRGWYKGYWCDSGWELAYVVYCLDHGIKIIRNRESFPYVFEGETHKFYPDYILEDGTYVELKGYLGPGQRAKLEQFPHPIQVIDGMTIKPFVRYVALKYGNDYVRLYEKA
jgi:hypothetical protein